MREVVESLASLPCFPPSIREPCFSVSASSSSSFSVESRDLADTLDKGRTRTSRRCAHDSGGAVFFGATLLVGDGTMEPRVGEYGRGQWGVRRRAVRARGEVRVLA